MNWKLIVMIAVAVLFGAFSHKWLGHDNILEEFSETIINNNTGYEIDFTPTSPENY